VKRTAPPDATWPASAATAPDAAPPPSTAPKTAVVAAAAPPRARGLGPAILGFLGSMRLAMWLVLLLAALTWLGTLAQTTRSTYDVQREYFESWFVLAELELSFWGKPLWFRTDGTPFALRIPLPGAYPVMALLFANLIVGGLLRMKWQARNVGILVTHVGIALLLVAGFVKLHYSWSGSLMLYETPADGNRAPGRNYESSVFRSFQEFELAVLREVGDRIEERVVPESALYGARHNGRVTVRGEGLPFAVEVHHWMDFAKVVPKGPNFTATNPVVDGAVLMEDKHPPGEQPEAGRETAGCYVTIVGNGGERIEGLLWGFERQPFDRQRYPLTFTIGGERFGLDLRHTMYELPFALRLDKFQKLDHPGTLTPRDFRSFVSVLGDGQPRTAEVFMNNPLRQDGYVVYQASWGPQNMAGPPWFTGLEVSYNPSDIWPALACGVIFLGLLLHFVSKLRRFLGSSTHDALAKRALDRAATGGNAS
jgi:hypothetical protein